MSDPQVDQRDDPGPDRRESEEVRAAESDQSSYVARAGTGAPPHDPRDEPQGMPATEGTAAGSPVAGVTIDAEDAQDAVSGDTGPEHPGTRRST